MLLEIDRGIDAVITQPVTIQIVVDRRPRRYTPDIEVTWREARSPFGRSRVIFEVKPYAILKQDYEDLAPKFHAARAYFRAQGIGFRVITDRSIYRPRQANAVRIGPAMRDPLGAGVLETVRAILTYPDAAAQSFGAVKRALMTDGLFRHTAERSLLHLIGMGYLTVDLEHLIEEDTMLRWWACTALEAAALEAQ
jgi:hypothetical protein